MLQHPAHCAPCLNIISGGWSLALDYKQCLWLQHTADHGSSGRLLSHISFCNPQLQSMNNNWIEDPGDQRAKNDSVDCISLALLTHLRDSIAEAEPLHFCIHCVTIRQEVEDRVLVSWHLLHDIRLHYTLYLLYYDKLPLFLPVETQWRYHTENWPSRTWSEKINIWRFLTTTTT